MLKKQYDTYKWLILYKTTEEGLSGKIKYEQTPEQREKCNLVDNIGAEQSRQSKQNVKALRLKNDRPVKKQLGSLHIWFGERQKQKVTEEDQRVSVKPDKNHVKLEILLSLSLYCL